MNVKGILFDWDGVIVDSMPNLAKGIQEVSTHYGVEVSVEYILENYFQPREAFYKSIGVKAHDVGELIRLHLKTMSEHQGEEQIFSDVKQALQTLSNKCLLGVVSANAKERIVSKLLELELGDLINEKHVFGGEKSKDEKLNIAIETFGLDKGSVLYVGDLPSDVRVAKAVGVRSAGLGRNEADLSRLGKEGPDYLINSLNELADAINRSRN